MFGGQNKISITTKWRNAGAAEHFPKGGGINNKKALYGEKGAPKKGILIVYMIVFTLPGMISIFVSLCTYVVQDIAYATYFWV